MTASRRAFITHNHALRWSWPFSYRNNNVNLEFVSQKWTTYKDFGKNIFLEYYGQYISVCMDGLLKLFVVLFAVKLLQTAKNLQNWARDLILFFNPTKVGPVDLISAVRNQHIWVEKGKKHLFLQPRLIIGAVR